MAGQLADRFGISGRFNDTGELLRATSPDVVHLTTPPQSHYALSNQCIDAGSHVYVEKPFTVTAVEAKSLLEQAQGRKVCITAGHNYQFTSEMIEMRRLIRQGFLGGDAVHLESYWSYDLGDLSYVGPLLGNPEHWVRQLPGQLLHNLISHGIARLAEFLDSDIPHLSVSAYQSPRLKALGGREIIDELRVLLRDKNDTSALFCFSTQIKPGLNRLNLYGPTNSMTVDITTATVARNAGKSYKSLLNLVVPPLNIAREQFANARRNALNIVRWRLHQDSGMKELIERFYQNIRGVAPPPIPYREILLTATIMDRVFEQLRIAAETSATLEAHV